MCSVLCQFFLGSVHDMVSPSSLIFHHNYFPDIKNSGIVYDSTAAFMADSPMCVVIFVIFFFTFVSVCQ